MDIGTWKILPNEMNWVKHHMIDIVNPDENFSVEDFHSRASGIIESLHSSWKVPILVWWTGLYIDSIIYDFSFWILPANKSLREELWKLNNLELYEKLQSIDPEYATEIHPNNRVYVERAIEVKMWTWKSKKDFRRKKTLVYDVLFLSPDYNDRDMLYKRINTRVESMFDSGAEEEVQKLLSAWYKEGDFGMNSIWYREFFPYLNWELSRRDLIAKIQQNSRNYAKRQITWFSKYMKHMDDRCS